MWYGLSYEHMLWLVSCEHMLLWLGVIVWSYPIGCDMDRIYHVNICLVGMVGMHANHLLMNSSAVSRQTEHNSEKLDALIDIFASTPNQYLKILQTCMLHKFAVGVIWCESLRKM